MDIEHDAPPVDRGRIYVISQNSETGMIAASTLVASETPEQTKAALLKEYGAQVGTIVARHPTGPGDIEQMIGTIHQHDVPYPHHERTFTRISFAFVATARGKMDDATRVAYLAAVLPAPDAKPASRAKAVTVAPIEPAPKAAAKKVAAKSTPKRR